MYAISTTDYSTFDTWIMVLISSIACILGASVVFVDLVYPSSQCAPVLERPAVVASSMALGSGVMLFSALYTLLPASRVRLQSDYGVYICYFVGILATLVITRIVHSMAPDAIHSHSTDDIHHSHDQYHPSHRYSESSTTSSSTTVASTPPYPEEEDETKQMFSKSAAAIASPNERTRLIPWDDQHVEQQYRSRDHRHHPTFATTPTTTTTTTTTAAAAAAAAVTTGTDGVPYPENDDYFRIGIQTAVAICIHKFPEGLIMFISGQASETIGVSVCFAMTIHNFIEGFMIAMPLYFATQSRVRAFFYAALLGGMSQPLGAALGVVALDTVTQEQQDALFGITFGVVSGMMSLIAVQSMLPQAIKADPQQRYVSVFFFVGILLVGLASLLKSV